MRRIGAVLLALLLLQSTGHAACESGDCKNGTGRLTGSDGRVYEGQFRNGYLWGTGTLTSPDGTVYKGQFVNGRFHGEGVLIGKNGRRYTGGFRDGVISRPRVCRRLPQ